LRVYIFLSVPLLYTSFLFFASLYLPLFLSSSDYVII
jgi:hypothetical protein